MDLTPLLSSVLQSSIETGATLVAAGTAVWGITAWRREHVGKRKIDLAEQILALAYEARDVFEAIRSPLGRPEEGSTRKASSEETPTETAMLNYAFIQVERCNHRADLFAKLRSLRYRFMAQHGPKSGEPFDEMNSIRLGLMRPVNSLHLQINSLRKRRTRMSEKDYDAQLEQLWDQWHEERNAEEFDADCSDLVLKRFGEAVSRLEEACRETIASRA
jgi:hypothetical protein